VADEKRSRKSKKQKQEVEEMGVGGRRTAIPVVKNSQRLGKADLQDCTTTTSRTSLLSTTPTLPPNKKEEARPCWKGVDRG
jgi:hypothetical protein